MYTLYNFWLFLHVFAVIVWVGGIITLFVINTRLARARDRAGLAVLAQQSSFFGSAVFMPAGILTLVSGILMVLGSAYDFEDLWITWGFVGILVSVILGAVLTRRTVEELRGLGPQDAARAPALQQRLATLTALNLLILLSVVWAMIFKPTVGS